MFSEDGQEFGHLLVFGVKRIRLRLEALGLDTVCVDGLLLLLDPLFEFLDLWVYEFPLLLGLVLSHELPDGLGYGGHGFLHAILVDVKVHGGYVHDLPFLAEYRRVRFPHDVVRDLHDRRVKGMYGGVVRILGGNGLVYAGTFADLFRILSS